MAKYDPKRKPRGPQQVGRPAQPDANWNDPEPDREAALAQCTSIKQKIEDAPSRIWEAATDFFEDVDKQVSEVAETITRTRRVTPRQKTALDNWEAAVDRWLQPRGDRDD